MRLPGDLHRLVYDFVDGPATPWTLCHYVICQRRYIWSGANEGLFVYAPSALSRISRRLTEHIRYGAIMPDDSRLIEAQENVVWEVQDWWNKRNQEVDCFRREWKKMQLESEKLRRDYLNGTNTDPILALALAP